jgi:proteasome lid subunit RPN8/RPN11
VVVPEPIREQLVHHAREEAPNEACGLVLLDGDVAVEYVRGRNLRKSPYRFELEIDPIEWAEVNDRAPEQAIFHSHLATEPRPSRTDIENIGLWEGRPYLILRADTGELAGWRILNGGVEPLSLE